MKTCTVCGAEWPDDTKFCPNDGSTLRSASGTADLIDSVIADRYHISKKLGEGGMGAVYLGEHVKMGRKSAIKVMAQSMTNDPEAIARFNREAANAARINHPNVCAIYDFGETPEGMIYLAMEFIEGEALSDLLAREGALELPRAVGILEQAADALQAAHDLGIVHRDLKPDNIMITRGRGQQEVVKVVDFGIAKAMGGEEGQKVTKTGLVVGTPEYMSPEQLSGDVLDGRSDVYSLALVFFRMVTGTLPFQADSAQETMIKRLTDDPMPLEQARPGAGFPQQLQAVMDRALQRMPADRYKNALELSRDAIEAVGSAPATVSLGSVDTEGATQMIESADVTAQLARTEVAPAPEPTTPATPAPLPSPRPEARKKKPTVAIAASAIVIAAVGVTFAVKMSGSGDDAQRLVGDTAGSSESRVTGSTDTAAQGGDALSLVTDPPATGGETGPQSRDTVVTSLAVTDPVETPTLDSAVVENELNDLFDDIEDIAQRPAARERARALYNDPRVAPLQRAYAASIVGGAYELEQRLNEACHWYQRAAGLDPTAASYSGMVNSLGCNL